MTGKHTPAPWSYQQYSAVNCEVMGPKELHICFTANSPEGRANAQLIATAPELLEEGRKLVEWLDRLAARSDENAKDRRFVSLAEANAADAKNYRATAKGMRAAIAKAEGKV